MLKNQLADHKFDAVLSGCLESLSYKILEAFKNFLGLPDPDTFDIGI